MFSTPILVRKINDTNYKVYAPDKLIKELISGDTRQAE